MFTSQNWSAYEVYLILLNSYACIFLTKCIEHTKTIQDKMLTLDLDQRKFKNDVCIVKTKLLSYIQYVNYYNFDFNLKILMAYQKLDYSQSTWESCANHNILPERMCIQYQVFIRCHLYRILKTLYCPYFIWKVTREKKSWKSTQTEINLSLL